MLKLLRPLPMLLMCGLMTTGCGQSQPAPAPNPANSGVTLTPTESASGTPANDPPVTKAKPLSEATPRGPVAVNAQSFPEQAFLKDDIVGLVVAHPKRLTQWPVFTMLKEAGALSELEDQLMGFGLQPESIERVAVVIDPTYVKRTAKGAGLETEADAPAQPVLGAKQIRNNLKQMALSLHNYHDTYGRLPRANGNGEGNSTGLSWRVHLLPYLDELELYEQFNFEEPWDSEQNKKLVEKMPAIFASPGVTEAGKTSMHVFTGKGTPFDGDKGTRLAEFVDGTSNTILAVMAGADTADTWTKPGGLVFDAASPKKALGEITDGKLYVVMSDGSAQTIPQSIADATFANMIQRNDGNVVDFEFEAFDGFDSEPTSLPTLILTLVSEADRPAIVSSILGEATEESYEGQTIQHDSVSAVWFADAKTVVCGPIESVKGMIDTKKAGKPSGSSLLSQIQLGADMSLAIDVASQSALLEQVVQTNPMLGMALQVKALSLQATVTGTTDDKLLELVVSTTEEKTAAFLSQLAGAQLAQAKQQLGQLPIPDGTDEEKKTKQLIEQLVKSADIKQNGDRIEFAVMVPEGFDKLPELLKPSMQKAIEARDAARKRNNLKQIGLAFHNYHDVFQKFPGAGRSAAGMAGLSWRVHLLPFLDHAQLYSRFKLDEPWDSEHNKALIAEMPEIFAVDGVTEEGKTSIHVFTGKGAPFANDETPGIASFVDGTSNTILVVQAGADTADIWTKPGGLDFDPKNPIKAMGTLVGDFFLVLMTDGSVRNVKPTIEAETLRRLIEHKDGEAVGEF